MQLPPPSRDWTVTQMRSIWGVPFAKTESGEVADVEAVERGKACKCRCFECDAELVARKGDVRRHHFAHSSDRKCRDAMEASLYAMTLSILRVAGAKIRLPGSETPQRWFKVAGVEVAGERVRKFLDKEWIVPPEQVRSESGFLVTVPSLKYATPDFPELVEPELGIELHFVSQRKRIDQLPIRPTLAGRRVYGLDLRGFVAGWWDVCDTERTETQRSVTTATEELRTWLAESDFHRGVLYHPLVEDRWQKFTNWIEPIASAEREDRERRERELARFFQARRPKPPPSQSPGNVAEAQRRLTPPKPNTIVQENIGTCPRCRAPTHRAVLGSRAGYFEGKSAEVCSQNPDHPFTILCG